MAENKDGFNKLQIILLIVSFTLLITMTVVYEIGNYPIVRVIQHRQAIEMQKAK